MCNASHADGPQHRRSSAFLLTIAFFVLFSGQVRSQTASTGALTGLVLDPSGAALRGAVVVLTSQETGATDSATSNGEGDFSFLLLLPGDYEVKASKTGPVPLIASATANVRVTETAHLDLHLRLATVIQSVSTEPTMLQTDSSSLGRVVNEAAVNGLPLVTRNFAQIASLSPGVVVGVLNAGELGLGGTALSQIAQSNDGIFVHGARSYDNNFQLDGISVSDVQGSAAGSGGIPIPNPDSIQEFKVQTGLYDAAYGRYAGANVSLITKAGSNAFHGTVFEFFRNEILNANDFFLNQTDQPRPVLKQNQFGFAFGGPIKKGKLILGSYQGTRQVNGLAAGQSRTACTASLNEPPLTNDRTAAALGKLFGGMPGAEGGTAVASDGSNINPAALALLNLKLADGSFLIPTPQTVDPTKSLSQQGFSVFTNPCHFTEDQFVTNVDYLASPASRIDVRLFVADDAQDVTFPETASTLQGTSAGFHLPAIQASESSGSPILTVSVTLGSTMCGLVRSALETARRQYLRLSGRMSRH